MAIFSLHRLKGDGVKRHFLMRFCFFHVCTDNEDLAVYSHIHDWFGLVTINGTGKLLKVNNRNGEAAEFLFQVDD